MVLNIEMPLKRGCILFGVWYLSHQDIPVRRCLFITFPPFYSIILLPVLTMVNEEVTAFFPVFHGAWEMGARSLPGWRGLAPNEPVGEKFPLALILPGINLWIKCREQRGVKRPCSYTALSLHPGLRGWRVHRTRDSPSQENQSKEEKHFH